MIKLKDHLNRLNTLIALSHLDEALETYYGPRVVIHENENASIVGLTAYKEMGRKVFYANAGNAGNYSAELLDAIVSDDITACQWHYRFDHTIWGVGIKYNYQYSDGVMGRSFTRGITINSNILRLIIKSIS